MAHINRIYLESNILIRANWPRVSAGVENLFHLAQILDVDIHLPQAVEVELENHWIRDFDQKCARINGSVTGLKLFTPKAARKNGCLMLCY